MKHWDRIYTFYQVAHYRSFTEAADHLNISQSCLSRSILLLEAFLNVTLFDRHGRGLSLTSEGQLLYQAAERAFNQLQDVEAHFKEVDTPQGILTLATSASSWLLPYLTSFREKCPKVHVY